MSREIILMKIVRSILSKQNYQRVLLRIIFTYENKRVTTEIINFDKRMENIFIKII